MATMKSMRMYRELGDFRLDVVEKPVPKGDEILIKIGSCGICGSDIPRVYTLGLNAKVTPPVILGHEFCGTVVEVGNPEKDGDLIGKKTAVFPLIPCNNCPACETGNYCQCQNNGYLGSRNDGGFAEYCLIPSRWHLIIPENQDIDLDALGLTEPACVAQHAVRRGRVTAGQTVVVLGAGPIGLMTARWAKIFGAKNVILTDIDDGKKAFGEARGFKVINTLKEDPKEYILSITNGRGADVVIEGTGSGAGLNTGIDLLRIQGTLVWLGNPHSDTTIKLSMHSNILRKELTMYGVWNDYYAEIPLNEWDYTVACIGDGTLKVDDLITHRASLDDLKALFDGIYDRSISICKALYSSKLDK